MASYLRPRRGKKSTAESQNIVLKRGEIFFEVPSSGIGSGIGKLKMGDGTTAYANLPYFMEQSVVDVSTAAVSFTVNSSTDNTTLLNAIASGATVQTIIGAVKKLLSNLNTSVTTLNNDLGGLKFGIGEDGIPGWIKNEDGADTVIPFKSGSRDIFMTYSTKSYDQAFLNINDNTVFNDGNMFSPSDRQIICNYAGTYSVDLFSSNSSTAENAATIQLLLNNTVSWSKNLSHGSSVHYSVIMELNQGDIIGVKKSSYWGNLPLTQLLIVKS